MVNVAIEAVDVSADWERVRAQVRLKVGEDQYRTWLQDITIDGFVDGKLTLALPTRFLRSFVDKEYGSLIKTYWLEENTNVRDVEFVVHEATKKNSSRKSNITSGKLPKNVDIWSFIRNVDSASPVQMMVMEREGVDGQVVKAMAEELRLPVSTFYDMLGLPKATIEKKISANKPVAGAYGQAALAMAKLLAAASNIVHDSTSKEANNFDVGKWLGLWVTRPQPSLGGKRPAEFLDTPTGAGIVHRLLGAIESGAYL